MYSFLTGSKQRPVIVILTQSIGGFAVGHVKKFNCFFALLDDVLDTVRKGEASITKFNLARIAFKRSAIRKVK